MQKLKQMLARVRFFDPLEDWALMILLGIIGLLVAILLMIAQNPPLPDLIFESSVVGAIYFTLVCLLIYSVVEDDRLARESHNFYDLWPVPIFYVGLLLFLGAPFAAGFSLAVWILYGFQIAGWVFGVCLIGAAIPTLATISTSFLVWLVEPFLEKRRQKYREALRRVLNG